MSTTTENTDLSSIPDEQPTGANGSKLAGRVALVTGGTRGIGAAIGFSLASHGAEIAAGFSGNVAKAEEFAKDFAQRFGPTSHYRHAGCRKVGQGRGGSPERGWRFPDANKLTIRTGPPGGAALIAGIGALSIKADRPQHFYAANEHCQPKDPGDKCP